MDGDIPRQSVESSVSRVNRASTSKSVATSSTASSSDTGQSKAAAPQKLSDDQLQISSEVEQLDHLLQSLEQVDEVDQKRIESIRQAIKSGDLTVNFQQLAQKIMELSDEFNNRNEP